MIVAIDGPAGSGKSTVARRLAARLRFGYLDTGAMYRCVALASIRRWGERPPSDPSERTRWEQALTQLAASLAIELRHEQGGGGVAAILDGEDVTGEIRTNAVSEIASAVAAVAGVRTALVAKQQQIVADGDWVAEGRDIGTVVAPAAELKVFLTADAAERARRRSAELGADERTILLEQAIRDARDSEREHSPLQAAADAEPIDTTSMSIDEAVERIAALVQERAAR
ncbi:MAG: (d)CMP kinase [Solirubrobacteraceae bacterium]